MSESEEEENCCYYGKPLEPYDEDAFPKKRPITVEEQIATDAQGRRRFHGAFTGGFSAGFYNTVGSLEGWTPTDFKSSRQEKTSAKQQKPQDFMDDEDFGEFGFAPETVKATSDFSTVSKRKRPVVSDGPIPGEPVLHSLITSATETIGYLLLKNIGLQEKINTKKQISLSTSTTKTYGCEMPSSYEVNTISSVLEDDRYKIPDIYHEYLKNPKTDTFGLGYKGLDKGNINLFKSTSFKVKDRNNKTLSVTGQAFGVGAFEEDDADIYAKEDMSRYDFEITKEKEKTESTSKGERRVFDLFLLSKKSLTNFTKFPPPTIPHSFTGKHSVKKSRFEPLPDENAPLSRRDINPAVRAKYLGEEAVPGEDRTSSKSVVSGMRSIKQEADSEQENSPKRVSVAGFNPDLLFDRFVSSSQPDDATNILEAVKPFESCHGTQDMRDAVKMKMFGPLTRVSLDWRPCAVLCKRFNVPEPNYDGSEREKRKRTKNLIFEYQQHNESEGLLKPGLSVMEEKGNDAETSRTEMETGVDDQNKNGDEITVSDKNNEPSTSQEKSPTTATTEIKQEEQTDPVTVIGITDKIDIEQNIDLFKAVFLSSSESESGDEAEEKEDKEEEEERKKEQMESEVLSDTFLPKIRPLKEGILSNIDSFIKFIPRPKVTLTPTETPPIVEKDASDVGTNEEVPHITETDEMKIGNNGDTTPTAADWYGPKLPERSRPNPDLVKVNVNTKIDLSDDDDEWVEKGEENKRKKHKKKHKKEKKHKKKKQKN